MDTFNNSAQFLVIITLIICIIIGKNITKKDIYTIDGAFSLFGFTFGIFMTLFNLKYVSKDLFLLSPLIAITCITYLRFRNIFSNKFEFSSPLSNRTLKVISIFYWFFTTLALISYNQSPIYHRSPLFFVFISICIALTGILIVYSNVSREIDVLNIYIKTVLVSLILSASAFFISPYPVGSDPWAHLEYVNNYLQFGSLTVSGATTRVGAYYLNFPISHLFATVTSLITNLSTRVSFYLIGVILILSTIFTYLLVKEICNNSKIALFSMFLISFADCHIHWTDQVIAMSFGLAIYSIIIYLIIKSNTMDTLKLHNRSVYLSLLLLFILLIIWTHTISAFITLITIICLYIMYLANRKMSFHKSYEELGSLTLCVVMTIALVNHWMDPDYAFFDKTIFRLLDSLSAEAAFLDLKFNSNVRGSYEMLLLPLGFLIYTFFGIIGSISTLSELNYFTKKIQLLFVSIVLYGFRYTFPVLGIRNIIPDRWPSFIYVIFVLFITIGFFKVLSSIKNRKQQITSIFVILFVTSFFMVTDRETNVDSPIYGENVIQRYVWTSSEISLFKHLNTLYDDVIVVDQQTEARPFETYLYRDRHKVISYPVNSQGGIEWDVISNNLIIWRKTSLSRPLSCSLGEMVLGPDFETKLNNNFNCIYNTGEAKAFV